MLFKPRRLLFALIVIAAAAFLLWYYSRPDAIPVTLYTVAKGQVESTVANTRAGTVDACRHARITPAASGQVARLLVHEGSTVEQGQVLLELWNDDLRAQLELAEQEAKAAVARVDEACVQAENSQREAQRQVKLHAQGLVSNDAVDRATTDAKARSASCRAARANRNVSASRVDVAHAALERTVLRAPFDGTVAEVTGEIGEFVTPSPPGIPTPPAVDLVDNTCLYVSAPIDEVDAPAIRAGMPARITLDAFPKRKFAATVRRVAPYVLDIEKQARTVDVEADFTDPDDARGLLTGYSADLEVVLDTHEDVLRIPTPAILEGNHVLVYDSESGTLAERTIETALSNWEWTEVASGLQVNEMIVTSIARDGVKAGAHVTREASPTNDRDAR